MNFITGKSISRRTMLHGMGSVVGLPLLDAMIPAGKPLTATEAGRAADKTRMVCIEQVHGAAGVMIGARHKIYGRPGRKVRILI